MDKKAEILKSARELFSANGFKDTSVSDITKKAGIAAGTFYLYYPSKDRLFMELFLEENVKLKKQIMASIDLDGDPMLVTQELIRQNFAGMSANPILREWYNREVFTKIEQNYRVENGVEHIDFLYATFIEVIKKWQSEGKMRADIAPEMIMAMFAAIINIDTHKDEVGIQYFPEILGYLSAFVMQGLTNHPTPSTPAMAS